MINMMEMITRISITVSNWHNYKAIVFIFLCHSYYDFII